MQVFVRMLAAAASCVQYAISSPPGIVVFDDISNKQELTRGFLWHYGAFQMLTTIFKVLGAIT